MRLWTATVTSPGNLNPATGERPSMQELVRRRLERPAPDAAHPGKNTTLTVLVTDLVLGGRVLRQLARQVHTCMGRAIQPFHTPTDGDVLFTVSMGTTPDERRLANGALGVIASEVARDAVLAAVGTSPGR